MIDVINLKKNFGELEVLKGIDLTVNKGDIIAVIGPSGSGKSTFLRCLNCMEDPTEGQIIFKGVDIADMSVDINIHRRHIGMVFQHFNLFNNKTVIENIMLAPVHVRCQDLKKEKRKKGVNKADLPTKKQIQEEARTQALDLLKRIGLEDKAEAYPSTLSGGQKQRVAIVRALAMNPDVILFDEPMSALDVDTRMILRQELKDLQKQFGTTMIYITHDQEEAFAMSDRIMVMDNGVIRQIDTPDNIVKNPADDYVRRFVLHNLQLKIESLSRFSQSSSEGAEQQA